MKIRLMLSCLAAVMFAHAPAIAMAADPLDVPAILPITGSAAFLGKEFGETLRLLEDRVNKNGGINGRPIHFAVQDDQSNPQVAVQLANSALSTNPKIIVNGGPLALCLATAPLVANGPVMYCFSPSVKPDPDSFTFAVMASSRDCLVATLAYFKNRGFKKIGVLNGTDATGADADSILADAIKLPEFAGMSYSAYEHFNLADLSVAAQISRIKASGAQALISYTTGTPIATVLHGMVDGGLDVPIMTSNGNMSVPQLDGYKSFMPKELIFPGYVAFTSETAADPGVQAKIDQFRADMRGAGVAPDLLHAIPYDATLLVFEALKRAGPGATSAQLRNALDGVQNWPGMLGRFDFRAIPNRGLGLKAMSMLKWDATRSVWVMAPKD